MKVKFIVCIGSVMEFEFDNLAEAVDFTQTALEHINEAEDVKRIRVEVTPVIPSELETE